MQAILAVTIPFFGLVLLGWVAARRQWLPASAIPGLNAYVLFFALPSMLFRFGSSLPLARLADPVQLANQQASRRRPHTPENVNWRPSNRRSTSVHRTVQGGLHVAPSSFAGDPRLVEKQTAHHPTSTGRNRRVGLALLLQRLTETLFCELQWSVPFPQRA